MTLLPYVEQQALFNYAMTNPADTWDPPTPTGQPVRLTAIKPYQCPSDPTMSSGFPSNQIGNWAGTSYAANYQMFGTNMISNTNCYAPQFNIGNIPDGSSNTIGFAEQLAVTGSPSASGNGCWAWPGIAWGWQNTAVIANTMTNGAFAFSPPQTGIIYTAADKRLVNSGHMNSVMVGLFDGSVRSVSGSISQLTWSCALQGNDGLPLGSDW